MYFSISVHLVVYFFQCMVVYFFQCIVVYFFQCIVVYFCSAQCNILKWSPLNVNAFLFIGERSLECIILEACVENLYSIEDSNWLCSIWYCLVLYCIVLYGIAWYCKMYSIEDSNWLCSPLKRRALRQRKKVTNGSPLHWGSTISPISTISKHLPPFRPFPKHLLSICTKNGLNVLSCGREGGHRWRLLSFKLGPFKSFKL